MSMYSMIMQMDELAANLLHLLRIDPVDLPRFRDCYLNKDGTQIVVLTRTGGGNRSEYQEANEAIAEYDNYVSDEDAGSDSTYAYFYFSVPEADNLPAILKKLATEKGYGREPAIERMMGIIKKMGDPTHADDADVKRVFEASKPLMEQLKGVVEGKLEGTDGETPIRVIEV